MALAGIGPAGEDTTRAGTHRLESQWRPDFQAARHYANDRSGEVRFMIIDPFGRADRLHQGASAPMASLFKALLLATYLSQGDVRDRSLRDWEKDLLGPMIKRSDNESATRVRDMLGAGKIKRMARRAHMQDFSYHPVWGLSRSSPRDQANFFLKLERYLPERHEGYAKYLLAHIVKSQRWGVGKVRPKGWRLYFKGGWGSGSGSVNHQTRAVRARRMPGGAVRDDGEQPEPRVWERVDRGSHPPAAARLRRRLVPGTRDPAAGPRPRALLRPGA